MFKVKEYYNNSEPGFSLTIQTPYEYSERKPHNLINFKFWKYSIWLETPEFIKPKKKWVDCSKTWARPNPDGKIGYFDYTQKQYGFSFVSYSGIHIYYGIQPGSWSPNDLKNSDHVVILNYFWNLQHVRFDAYDIYGNYLCSGDHFREWEYRKNIKPFNKETRDIDFQTVQWFSYPKDPNYKHNSFLSQEPYDNFSDVQSNVEVYQFFEYEDKYDGKKTIARINIEEREWIRGKWKWLRAILKHVPGCQKIRREIKIDFRDEVGSKKGSWKGGIMGTGYEMLPGETLTQCWKRFCENWKER